MKLKSILTAFFVAIAALVQPALAEWTFDKNGEPTHHNGVVLPPIQTVEQARVATEKRLATIKREETGRAVPSDKSLKELFYTGKPLIGDTYQFKYRVYSPEVGRWLTFDPSGFPDGPNNLLFVNNWVMSALDAQGLDIIHINNSSAVDGAGHSGAFIGNQQDGYTYHSYGAWSSSSGASYDTANGQSFTFEEALAHAGQEGYDRYQGWYSSSEQDAAARDAFGQFAQSGYNPTTHNCLGAVQAALDAGGVSYEGSNSFIPNQFFNINNLYGELGLGNGVVFFGTIE